MCHQVSILTKEGARLLSVILLNFLRLTTMHEALLILRLHVGVTGGKVPLLR
jgi:hypothetical protein